MASSLQPAPLLLLTLLACAVGSGAAPAFDERQAHLYAQYARVSFCARPAVEAWDCGDMCSEAPSVPGSPVFFGPGARFSVQGYAARLPGLSARCIVAFRGTSNYNMQNILADALAWRTEWPAGGASWCPGCGVMFGYAGAYADLRAEMLGALQRLNCSSVALAGHSLGAGVATIASMDLRAGLGVPVDAVWTFGKPRVGNAAFVAAYRHIAETQGADPPMWRVVHYHDLIPRLPMQFAGYLHEPLEVYYGDEQSTSYRECPPTHEHLEDPTCMLATPWYRCTMDDHCNYLHHLTFEEADFPSSCIPVQPSPWPLVGFGTLLLCFLSVCCWLCCKRRRRQKSSYDPLQRPLM